MTGREQILGRVRRALQVPAPKRHAPAQSPATERFARELPVIRQEAREWLPPVGETWDEQMDLFASQCTDLRAEFFLCADEAEMHHRLASLSTECGWQKIAAHPGALTDKAAASLPLPALMTHSGYDLAALEQCDAALTECDALVAQTGSVLITKPQRRRTDPFGADAASCGADPSGAACPGFNGGICPAVGAVRGELSELDVVYYGSKPDRGY